jgi:LysR family transcriptional regulator, nitrogen assimilation regulatory protein
LDLKRLRCFQEVAAAGSLSYASDRLRLAQPALSRHISLLEQEIGVPLFTRHGRGMQLTEAGAALLARIDGPLRQLERAAAEVRTLSGVVSGHVAVGMMPTVAAAVAGDLAQQMTETYPDVALRIVEGYDGHLMEWVQRGNVDTTLLYGPAADLHLRVRPLFIEELRLVFRPGTLTETSLTLAEAAEHPLVLPSRPHGLRKIVEAAFHVAHVSMPVRFEVDSYMLIKDLAERGLGCAILPHSSIQQSEAEGRLASASLEPPLRRQIVRALRPGPDPDRATEVTLAVLDSIIAVRATAGDWKLLEPKR